MTAPDRAPALLRLAAALVALQGAGLLALGVVGLVDLAPSRAEVGLSVAVFFGAYGAGLLACAWALATAQGWARGPVLITQLLQLGIAWNARANLPLAVPLALSALVVLAVVLREGAREAREAPEV